MRNSVELALNTCTACGRSAGRRASATHALRDLAELDRLSVRGLTPLRQPRPHSNIPARREGAATHSLRDLAELDRASLRGLTPLRQIPPHTCVPTQQTAAATHSLLDLTELERERAVAGLARLEVSATPAAPPPARAATTTHVLRDLAAIFGDIESSRVGRRRIRVCVVDTMLQTGGAEWFAAQLALAANPEVFEFVFVTYNSRESQIAKQLAARGFRVLSATALRAGSFRYSEWLDEELFELLTRLNPDLVFFSSQYLFEQLRKEQLEQFAVVVRISNFHAAELAAADFSAATKVICCTDEQYGVVRRTSPDKAVLIKTGVNTDLFREVSAGEKAEIKQAYGLEGKQVVLFVGRLGSPLKRVNVFQDVVRRIKAQRTDVTFVVVGYFSKHDGADEETFRGFVEEQGLIWKDDVPPWEMPAFFQMADALLSTSGEYEGLSNTVLQALAAGAIPVTTASAGMHELIEGGDVGFLVEDFGDEAIAAAVSEALDSEATTREQLARNGREKITERFSFAACAEDYQRVLVESYRRAPASVAITDGSFGTGGAEWLAALLVVNSEPRDVRFEIVLNRSGSPLSGWLADRGVRVHAAPEGMTYDEWRSEGLASTFQALRSHVVMPCTIMSWPQHEPFYRLLVISQNAADARKLTTPQYEQADYILCVSQEVLDQLDPAYRSKMSVLRNSIDVELFSPSPQARPRVREELDIPRDAPVVLWAGRMHEPHKRLDVLMDVVDATADDDGLHYLVVGYFREGEQEGLAAWRAFLDCHPNVSWVPEAPPWEMPRYYSAADLYLSTSGFARADFEGLSLTSVQALAAELPIVTTTSGGQREVVDDGINGRLVSHGDVEGLAAALRETASLDAARRQQIQAANRAKALERFDIREHSRLYGRIARLLKNNVGPALTADPELPAPGFEFSDARESSAHDIRRASSFLRYTWPLLASAVDEGAAADCVTEPADLRPLAGSLQPGQRVILSEIGPNHEPLARHPRYSARRINCLLDHLERSFPMWSACERRGPDLLMTRR